MLRLLFYAYSFLFPIDVYTVKSGNASDASVYNTGIVPDSTQSFEIMPNHVLTVDMKLVVKRAKLNTSSTINLLTGFEFRVLEN